MKSIKIVFLVFFLTCSFNSHAQTKEETIEWLKEKLGKYMVGQVTAIAGDGTAYPTAEDIKIESFNECEFVVTYTVVHSWEDMIYKYKVTFPTAISGVVEESFAHYKGFVLKYPADLIKVERLTVGDEYFTSYHFALNIALREENIIARIEKALKHLATFCPKKKETF